MKGARKIALAIIAGCSVYTDESRRLRLTGLQKTEAIWQRSSQATSEAFLPDNKEALQMADAFEVPATSGISGFDSGEISPPQLLTEEDFLVHWNKDVNDAAAWAARSAGLDRDEANDFAQEARIRLLVALRTGRARPECYVRTLIGHAVRSARRPSLRWASRYLPPGRPRVSPEEDAGETEFDVFKAAEEADLSDIVAVGQFIDTVPTRLCEVYDLLYVEGFTQEEVACRLRVTRQRVTQLHTELLRQGQEYFTRAPGRPN
jgi:RNA polymerase sigma factor (sigma-70 family)